MKNGVKSVQAVAYDGAGTVNCQVPNDVFVNLTIQESKFCKVAQLFIVSVSLVRGFLSEQSEQKKIFATYRTRAIITRSLYTFYLIFERQKRLFKELFS